jgi:hypothetical protein
MSEVGDCEAPTPGSKALTIIKHQSPKRNCASSYLVYWKIGISLELGAWELGFSDLAIIGNNSKVT